MKEEYEKELNGLKMESATLSQSIQVGNLEFQERIN